MFYGYQSSIIHAFMDIHLDILGFLWISIMREGPPSLMYPCIELLWILDPGCS